MNIRQALNYGNKKLSSKSTSPQLDSEVLLMFVTNLSKEKLLSNPEQTLTDTEKKIFTKLITKRAKRIPVAYLIGFKDFMGLKLKVDKNVLVPRPETELLVEKVIELADKKKNLKILDVGTGSGAIIISLAHKLGQKNDYFASDVSPKALEIAKLNAKGAQVKINFKHASLLKDWLNEELDIITANLPYLPDKTESTKYEPRLALVAKNKGIHIIKTFLMQAKNLKIKPQYILLEFGHDQAKAIKKLANQYLPEYRFKVFKDYSGFDRLCVLSLR